MDDWTKGVNWIRESGVDISSLFKQEKHDKEKGEKWQEVVIVCSPDIDIVAVKARIAGALEEFSDNVKFK